MAGCKADVEVNTQLQVYRTLLLALAKAVIAQSI